MSCCTRLFHAAVALLAVLCIVAATSRSLLTLDRHLLYADIDETVAFRLSYSCDIIAVDESESTVGALVASARDVVLS